MLRCGLALGVIVPNNKKTMQLYIYLKYKFGLKTSFNKVSIIWFIRILSVSTLQRACLKKTFFSSFSFFTLKTSPISERALFLTYSFYHIFHFGTLSHLLAPIPDFFSAASLTPLGKPHTRKWRF